jgi:hypothetical protein
MADAFGRTVKLTEGKAGDFITRTGLDGRLALYVHPNPENRILHTALVGEMNGVLQVLTVGEPEAKQWGTFGGPRAYTKWVQPGPAISTRPADAPGGAAVFRHLAKFSPTDREEAIAGELLRGNLPDFLRKWQPITIRGKDKAGREHTVVVEVMPDYLAIGSDADFVRVPMTPQSAQRVADAFGCALPTRKLVDEVYQSATVRLDPNPLTEAREAAETFVRHHELIEKQRVGKTLGDLVAGTKKDIVVTNRLGEKSNRVAIYGWHKLDGTPIQPLSIVHVNSYVDYSHGVRLVRRTIVVDGKPRDIRQAMHAVDIASLLSDEGPLDWPSY